MRVPTYLPTGVVSKNSIGLRQTLLSMLLCNFLLALMVMSEMLMLNAKAHAM